MSHKTHKSVQRACPKKVSSKGVPRECLATVSTNTSNRSVVSLESVCFLQTVFQSCFMISFVTTMLRMPLKSKTNWAPEHAWTCLSAIAPLVPLQATAKHSASFGTWQRCSWWQFLVEQDWWKGESENKSFHHPISGQNLHLILRSKHSLGGSASSHQQSCLKQNPYVSAAIRLSQT